LKVKATVVPDIRRCQFVPGAVQFDSATYSVFVSCPCGCGMLMEISRKVDAWYDRKTVSISNLTCGPEGKYVPNGPYMIRIWDEDDEGAAVRHWFGTLQNGEFESQ